MTSIPQVTSNGLQNQAALINASTASSQLYVNSYSSLDAGLTIQTREGDVVTLSTSRYSELDAYEYSSQGVLYDEDGYTASSYNVREITLSSGETFTFTVEGDLSEEELEDIESIVSGVDGIIGEMMEGDMQGALAKALTMGYYDSISTYQADITVERSYAMYSEERTSGAGALGQDMTSSLLDAVNDDTDETDTTDDAAGDLETSLMEQLAELLEEQEEEALARATQPLSELFDHYMSSLAEKEETQESEAVADETEPSLSELLETASKKVNQMITDMVKAAFENTLSSLV